MSRRRKPDPFAHVRSIFEPDVPSAQTSLFADVDPMSKPIHCPGGSLEMISPAERAEADKIARAFDDAIEENR